MRSRPHAVATGRRVEEIAARLELAAAGDQLERAQTRQRIVEPAICRSI